MLQIIEAHPNWPVYIDVFEHPPAYFLTPNLVRHDTCAVERGLAVNFCGQLQ